MTARLSGDTKLNGKKICKKKNHEKFTKENFSSIRALGNDFEQNILNFGP